MRVDASVCKLRRRTIKAPAGRYIFKRSAWVNTNVDKRPTTVYFGASVRTRRIHAYVHLGGVPYAERTTERVCREGGVE